MKILKEFILRNIAGVQALSESGINILGYGYGYYGKRKDDDSGRVIKD